MQFPGAGSFRVTFSITDSGYSLTCKPTETDSIVATVSSSMIGQTLNGNVSLMPKVIP